MCPDLSVSLIHMGHPQRDACMQLNLLVHCLLEDRGRLLSKREKSFDPHGNDSIIIDRMQCHLPQIWIRSCWIYCIIISHSGALAGYQARWRTVPEWLGELWYEDLWFSLGA